MLDDTDVDQEEIRKLQRANARYERLLKDLEDYTLQLELAYVAQEEQLCTAKRNISTLKKDLRFLSREHLHLQQQHEGCNRKINQRDTTLGDTGQRRDEIYGDFAKQLSLIHI